MTVSLLFVGLNQRLTTEAAKGNQLRQELEGAKKMMSNFHTTHDLLKLGLGIMFRELHMGVNESEPIKQAVGRISKWAAELAWAGL